ncbi:MAG: trigger factor [Gemmatimonadales bacterium]|nr:trigger factor [Gemmatimonadales bacterium]MDQ3428128.1 trigger factor [Gemmatimonadota bacterium]
MSEITVEKTAEDSASKSLRVTVPVDRVRQAEARAVRFYSQKARLPGFRPGKAPEGVVRKRFGDAIRQSVLEEIIRESWETAKTNESLKPITDPSIRNLKFEDGSPIEFDMLVEVRPELMLDRLGGFRVERRVAPVPESAVDEQLARLQEQKATWIPVAGEKPSPGQMVRVEVAPLENGVPGDSQPYDLVLGQNQAIPDLEERIMALLPGESADAEVRFPEDHPDESRRGQARQVRVTLHETKRQELPPLEDAFAREVGDFENLDALRAAVRQDVEREAQREADAQVRQSLLAQIVEANNVAAPESLVHRLMHGYAEMYGVPQEQLAGFEQQFHEVAEGQVRRDLVLDAVIESQGLRATESEVDERIARMAEARGVEPGQLYGSLQKANRLSELERSITEEKVFDFLLKQSTVEEVTL